LEKTKEGDTILLLGSADCTRYSAGNWKLAQDRADKIKKALEGEAEERKVDVEARALKQHDACKPSDQLRAVFPILIRPESVGH
jgi:flagellar motor protein MotB